LFIKNTCRAFVPTLEAIFTVNYQSHCLISAYQQVRQIILYPSICMMTGTLATPFVNGFLTFVRLIFLPEKETDWFYAVCDYLGIVISVWDADCCYSVISSEFIYVYRFNQSSCATYKHGHSTGQVVIGYYFSNSIRYYGRFRSAYFNFSHRSPYNKTNQKYGNGRENNLTRRSGCFKIVIQIFG